MESGHLFHSLGAQTPNNQYPNLDEDVGMFQVSRSWEDNLKVSWYLIVQLNIQEQIF